jgi:hypothetical protein
MPRKGLRMPYVARLFNKRGSAVDIILAVVILFIFAIGAFIMRYSSHLVVESLINTTGWQETVNDSNINITAVMTQSTEQAGQSLDKVIMGVFVGLLIGLIVTSWLVGGHPIFLVFYLIMVILGTVFATILSDVYYEITHMTMFGNLVFTDFPLTEHILHYLPIYIAIFGIVGLVIMFGKPGIQSIR